jgi:hypothetical protein
MIILIPLLWFIAASSRAETVAVPFLKPDKFPLTLRLVLSKEDAADIAKV